CLDALVIAVDTTADERGRWYTSNKSLQTVCLDLCVACRVCWNISTWHVMVTTNTPNCLWVRSEREALGKKGRGVLRVPPLPVRAVTLGEYPLGVLARLSQGVRLGARGEG
ncbi:unnamed protein product, partial [Pylaiella littoralis]